MAAQQHPGGWEWANLDKQAAAADAQFRQRLTYIDAAAHLSPLGKREEFEKARAEYTAAIAPLQEQGAALLTKQLAAAEAAELDARRAAEENERGMLGDAVMLAMLEKDLRRASTADVVKLAQDSVTDWRRAVLLRLASAEIADRRAAEKAAGPARSPELEQAHAQLHVMRYDAQPPELHKAQEQAAELRRFGESWIGALDRDGERRALADGVGVSYAHLVRAADGQPV